jgi:hypothetical protein
MYSFSFFRLIIFILFTRHLWRSCIVVDREREGEGSRPGGVSFETIYLCQRNLTFVKNLDKFDGGNVFIAKKFNICESLSKNFDIYIKIIGRDAGIFFQHQAELVLRHRMQVSNYFVKFLYSVGGGLGGPQSKKW